MKKYILFDLDGTLTDSHEGIIKSARYALESEGVIENDDEVMKRYIGPPLIDSLQVFHGFSKEQAERGLSKYRERYNTVGLYENEMYTGIDKCLERLKASNKVIALATCKPEPIAKRIIGYFNLAQYFDVVVGSLDVTRKYKVQVIQEVFRQLKELDKDFNKANAIMIGDRKHDVLGAKEAGIECIGVRFGFAEKGELEEAGADYIVDTVDSLADFILSL